MLQKSGVAGSDQAVTAGCVGFVQLPGGLAADRGASGADRADPGRGSVVRGVPELRLELQADALVVEPLVQDATDCQLDTSLE